MKSRLLPQLNLQAKVALVAVGALLLAAGLLTFYYSKELGRAADSSLRRRTTAVATSLANECEYGLSVNRHALLQNAVVNALSQPDILSAVVFNDQGEVVAAAGQYILQEKRRLGSALVHDIDQPKQMLDDDDDMLGHIGTVVVPIFARREDGDRKLGVTEVVYSHGNVERLLAKSRHSALLLTTVLVLAVSLAVSVGARSLVSPLRRLLRGTKELAAGNLSARVPVTSRDEIGELAAAFNDLGERLQESHRAVLDHQHNLERHVAGRTVELSAANARLLQEIVERKHSESRLREAETKYRTVVEQLPAITYLADVGAECRWHFVSPQITSILGYSSAEWQADPALWMKQMHPADRDKALATEAESCLTGAPFVMDYRMYSKDGRLVWFSDRGVVQRGTAPNSFFVHGVMFDVTDRKHLEQEFLQSQKVEAVGRLAGGVAHDFNNVLTAIMGYSDLIVRRCPAGDPVRANAEQIQKAADRAASLTRQLLAFSRKQVLEPKIFNLNDVIADLEKMLRRLIGEDVQFNSLLGAQLASVRADPAQIEQVIMNLVVNARDALPQGGMLTLQTTNVTIPATTAALQDIPPGQYVLLAVTDTGTGMTDEVRAHVFEPFFTTKPQGEGTGLGLATCFGIIKQSGGHIAVDSEIDQGSTFRVYLPAVAAGPATEVPEIETTIPKGTERILLVEDEPPIRELVALELRELGYHVEEAGNGVEALELISRLGQPVDLLLTDVVMPRMGGPELAVNLRQQYRDTRVLFTSGYTADTIGRHGILDEETRFLRKPFTAQGLARKVREVLDATT